MAENNINQSHDIDPIETKEWIEALQYVVENESPERAHFIIEQLQDAAIQAGINLPYKARTAYINTIPVAQQAQYPGDLSTEQRIDAFLRWNAMAMVVRAGKKAPDVGGHIASFASAATLYGVGLHHFFHTESDAHDGDFVFIQGHSSPGIYAHAYLTGRLEEKQLDNFRQEVDGEGISSYPHPWLMPDFWQFPTVSMGLGPIQAIYQARFLKYLHHRELKNTDNRHVWAFCGDGEMDEPESLGAVSIAVKEQLDNLIFVVNCNLQRLDGPVRGNGKIIQDLEGVFTGAGWNVIKIVWDSNWDALLAKDIDGKLKKLMMETIDGEYQTLKANDGAYLRENFFAKDPDLLAMVEDYSDTQLHQLLFGGLDPRKVFAAYHQAVNTKNGRPTAILAKTIKGYGMGDIGRGKNTTHQQKKLGESDIISYRDRFEIPVDDKHVAKAPYAKPEKEIIDYILDCRQKLGGQFPHRRAKSDETLKIPSLDTFDTFFEDSGEREFSTTMAFVRILNHLLKDKNISDRIVPIIPDECRTFGMEGLFRQIGIYSPVGQLYKPVDSSQLMYYKESVNGQLLEEGLTEAGAFSSWLAAATSYSTNNLPMLPFYIYYSMFGHQRIGDLAWAAGDMRARGFLLGGTAGRTTLAGEGLQHQDGHTHIFANVIPNCRTYDPTFDYELAVIIQHGLQEMYVEQKDLHYYITVMNENYHHPAMPKDCDKDIIKGMYLLQKAKAKAKQTKVQLLGSGTILREVMKAAEILEKDYNIAADIWSVTSFNELTREAADKQRWQHYNPDKKVDASHVQKCLEKTEGPLVAATDYIRAYAEQIRPYVGDKHYVTLGTDGFGRSDSREKLRYFFEVDAPHVAYAALKALTDLGQFKQADLLKARKKLGIDPNKPNPMTV
ncbi:MAG: pyruvate dehydrogenase (acetyl-transferring), homodimeric type [Legionellales bacterium]|nr:pyruvate dehydrogenase (acetyl-transferring), homodimeric type [Legionellales bacterium]